MTFELDRSDLRPFQEEGSEFIIDHVYCALWIGMRLGKTPTALTAIVDLFDEFAISKVLVVAPKRVAINSWPEDLDKWEHLQGLTYTLLRGTPEERREKVKLKTDIHIIGRDSLKWLVKHLGEEWPYDMVILDESRSFKNGKSERFRAIQKVLKYIDRIVELTGTPAPNGLTDLWGQFYLLDRGRRLGNTVTAFRDRWFGSNFDGNYTKYTAHPFAKKQIEKLVADITFVLQPGDYINLPEKIVTNITFDLPDDVQDMYDEFAKEFVLLIGDTEVLAPHAAAVLNKLMQIANGCIYTHESGEPQRVEQLHDEAFEYLDEIIESLDDEPLLLAYVYKFDKKKIKKRYPQVVFLDDDPNTLKRWNNKEIPILCMHPMSGGHGLNLFDGGHNIAWLGLTHDLEIYQQFNERLSHPDKKEPINIYHIFADVREYWAVLDSLNAKDSFQLSLVRNVKRRANL